MTGHVGLALIPLGLWGPVAGVDRLGPPCYGQVAEHGVQAVPKAGMATTTVVGRGHPSPVIDRCSVRKTDRS